MKIMTHVVAGYPSVDECIELMLGMQKLGVGMIEVQIPFSDPIADGETIMRANDKALESGMTTEDSFELVRLARKKGLKSEVYIMSYVQKVIHLGIDNFCRRAAGVDAAGLIIPDLPFDSPEYEQLSKAAKNNSLQIVPVVSPGMDRQRLARDLEHKSELVYLTSMRGITGNKLMVSDELGSLCKSVGEISPGSAIAVGFGVQSKKDVKEILKIADIAVVGSSAIREIEKSGVKDALGFIKNLVK